MENCPLAQGQYGGFPKIRDTFLGVPIIRTIVGSILGFPLFWETTIWGSTGSVGVSPLLTPPVGI